MSRRIRYGKIETEKKTRKSVNLVKEKVPKNTLSTIRNGELIHFGIARCHIPLDRFDKSTGKLIATNRANLAAREEYEQNNTGLKIHHSGLRGTVELSNIKVLLNYFQGIDLQFKNRE